MKKIALILCIASLSLIASTSSSTKSNNEISLNRYKNICQADDVAIAIMDIDTKKYIKIDSTFPENSRFSKELQKQMRKNVASITKNRYFAFGAILRPFVLGYIEKNNPQFTPSIEYLTTNDYYKFGDLTAKYISSKDIYKPFISFDMKLYYSKKPLTNVSDNFKRYYYTVVSNGDGGGVYIDELMKAYSKLFSDPSYKKTKELLLENFAPNNKNIGGLEDRFRILSINKDHLTKEKIGKVLVMYVKDKNSKKIISLILTNVKNRDCRKDNYLYKHFSKELIEAVKE